MITGNYIVFIQIHGEAEKLEKCLKSLANQTLKPYDVVIVDDGTPDPSVFKECTRIFDEYKINNISVEYYRATAAKEPNLDTVGIAIFRTWKKFFIDNDGFPYYQFLSILDVDSCPSKKYYSIIISQMKKDPHLVCASGVIQVLDKKEQLISAKVIKRNDARGSGKVIRTRFLANIPIELFPQVAWDTWINIKAKQAGKKTLQIPEAVLFSSRSTTRLTRRDNFRDGRLTYHFGYNPLLLLYKILFRGRDVLKGYRSSRKSRWKLPDEEVRKWFGWRYFFHFWK